MWLNCFQGLHVHSAFSLFWQIWFHEILIPLWITTPLLSHFSRSAEESPGLAHEKERPLLFEPLPSAQTGCTTVHPAAGIAVPAVQVSTPCLTPTVLHCFSRCLYYGIVAGSPGAGFDIDSSRGDPSIFHFMNEHPPVRSKPSQSECAGWLLSCFSSSHRHSSRLPCRRRACTCVQRPSNFLN